MSHTARLIMDLDLRLKALETAQGNATNQATETADAHFQTEIEFLWSAVTGVEHKLADLEERIDRLTKYGTK